jgi:membrane protein required for colicin V production
MNWVDILYLLLILGGLALGFFQGTIKLVVAVVSFYVGIILASLYFQTVGNFFRVRFHSSVGVSQITAFALILLMSFIILTIAGLYTFRYAKMPASLDFIDRIIGTVLGLFMSALMMGMMSLILQRLVSAGLGDVADLPIGAMVQSGVRSSQLLPFFARSVLPLLYGLLRPVLPAESQIIFQIQ